MNPDTAAGLLMIVVAVLAVVAGCVWAVRS